MNFFKQYLILCSLFFLPTALPKTVMLIPGGTQDAGGRTIGDYYEAGLTMQFCTTLSKAIEKISSQKKSKLSVIVVKKNTQKAHIYNDCEYINQHMPDLVLHIGFYWQPEEVPSLTFFYYSRGSIVERTQPIVPEFISIDSAHLYNAQATRLATQATVDFFKNSNLYSFYRIKKKPLPIPFLPLKGIDAPAFGCEIGISHYQGWQKLVDHMAEALYQTLCIL